MNSTSGGVRHLVYYLSFIPVAKLKVWPESSVPLDGISPQNFQTNQCKEALLQNWSMIVLRTLPFILLRPWKRSSDKNNFLYGVIFGIGVKSSRHQPFTSHRKREIHEGMELLHGTMIAWQSTSLLYCWFCLNLEFLCGSHGKIHRKISVLSQLELGYL